MGVQVCVSMEIFSSLRRTSSVFVIETHSVDEKDSTKLLLQALNLRLNPTLMQEEREEETIWRLNYSGESKGRQRPRLFLQGRLYRPAKNHARKRYTKRHQHGYFKRYSTYC